jgi:hypothetical protein
MAASLALGKRDRPRLRLETSDFDATDDKFEVEQPVRCTPPKVRSSSRNRLIFVLMTFGFLLSRY